MNRRIIFLGKLLLGIAIIGILIAKVGIASIVAVLSSANLIYLPIILFVLLMVFLINAVNIWVLLTPGETRLGFMTLLKYVTVSFASGVFTPGKIGELSLVYFLKKEGIGLGEAAAIVLLDKIITVIVTSIFGIIALFFFLSPSQGIAISIAFCIILIIALFFIAHATGRGLLKRYVLRSYASRFKNFSKALADYPRRYKSKILLNALFTFIRLVASTCAIALIFAALGQSVSLPLIFLIKSATIIISFVPLSPNGLGIKESVGVYLFSTRGIPASASMGMYLIGTCLDYAMAALFIILFLDEFRSQRKPEEVAHGSV